MSLSTRTWVGRITIILAGQIWRLTHRCHQREFDEICTRSRDLARLEGRAKGVGPSRVADGFVDAFQIGVKTLECVFSAQNDGRRGSFMCRSLEFSEISMEVTRLWLHLTCATAGRPSCERTSGRRMPGT